MNITSFISKGNKKLPKNTWIFNSGSARNCPSKLLGLCQCVDSCYAAKAERQYKDCAAYRERQKELSFSISSKDFAAMLLIANGRSRSAETSLSKFRFNESGDFVNQRQADWFSDVCRILTSNSVRCYGYTARTDLDLSRLSKSSFLCVSNDMNGWVKRKCNRFLAVKKYSGKNKSCAGNCRICSLCYTKRSQVIEVEMH